MRLVYFTYMLIVDFIVKMYVNTIHGSHRQRARKIKLNRLILRPLWWFLAFLGLCRAEVRGFPPVYWQMAPFQRFSSSVFKRRPCKCFQASKRLLIFPLLEFPITSNRVSHSGMFAYNWSIKNHINSTTNVWGLAQAHHIENRILAIQSHYMHV